MAILLGEVVMRFYYRSLTSDRALVLSEGILAYRHKPSIKFMNKYGIQVEYNSLGLIGKEVSPKNKDIFRIFGVGDSITAATYLPENERYLNRLAGLLSKETSKQIEIINTGVGGYNTRQGDLYDRFSVPFEHRFSKQEVYNLLVECRFINIKIKKLNFKSGWVVWGYKA